MPEQGQRMNVVMLRQRRDDVLPDPARAGRAMQEDEGRFRCGHADSVTQNQWPKPEWLLTELELGT